MESLTARSVLVRWNWRVGIGSVDIPERLGVEHEGFKSLYVAFLNGLIDGIRVENATGHKLAIGSGGCCAEVDDLCAGKLVPQGLPTCGNIMVSLIKLDQ